MNYTKIGVDFNNTDKREALASAIYRLEFKPITKGEQVAFAPGEAIKKAIKEFNIPAIEYAISHELSPYGLYGIKGNYKNGIHKIYFIDTGCEVIPVASI